MGRKFGTDRHRPPGEWVQATMTEEVAGIVHRKGACRSWASAVARAESAKLPYGIDLEPEPSNPHDANAIRVIGHATTRGFFGGLKQHRHFIGYLPAWLAQEINEDLISQGLPIAGELYSIYQANDFFDVKVLVLGPPGHSESARRKRRAKAEQE